MSQVLFISEHRAAHETLKIRHFSVNCYRYSTFWRYLLNLWGTCKKYIFISVSVNSNRSLTESKGRTEEYWPEVFARSVLPRPGWRPIFPSTARASSVSKLFIVWHSVSDSKMHFRWLALKNVHPSLKFRKNFNPLSFFW